MLKNFLSGFLAFMFLACVADGARAKTETIQAFWDTDNTVNQPINNAETVKIPDMAVDFDSENGAVTAIRVDGETITVEGESFMPFDVNQGEKETRNEKWVAWNNTEFLGLELLDVQTAVTRWKTGGWTVELFWILDSQRKMLGRKTCVRWDGDEEVKIRALWWRFPTLKGEESSYFYVPGQFPPKKVTLAELTQKQTAWERPGILQIAENRTAVFFMDYLDPTLDRGSTEVIRKGENGIQVTQVFNILGRMKSGTVQELGTTWMWVLSTDGESTLSEIHRGMAALGHTVPEGRPAEFQNMLLYSFHPGGSIGSNMQDLGGFSSAIPFVDRISATGANAVWMLPLESNGIYWPNDYYRFQDGLGTGDEFRALVKRMHDRGIYVMQDCVPHGGSNTYDRAKQHPEWLVYDEDGSTFHYWCFDFNWPTWREYMKNVAKYYMETYGVDGYRIDAVSGSKVPNWNPEIPYARASFAKLQAGFNMQKSIREGVKEVSPTHGGTLAEVGEDCFGLVSDAIYDFSGCYQVFQASRGMSAKEYVPALRRWLHECRLGGPKGMLRMRHSESHDSLRSQLWYGTTQARAIVALTAFIDGIPLLYQGQDVGNLETYAKIFAVRKALPEMQNAAYDYLGMEVPDGVFAVAYEKDGLRSVGLINFNSLPVRFNLAVSATEAENTPEKVSEKMS
ncbi:MAG: alpha-amylase family glycosyl hydrolase, partial [Planctomycetia bacterium]|nr:alpha-amylase family glycosyl hydrolase [Planctomycetia bacterium]